MSWSHLGFKTSSLINSEYILSPMSPGKPPGRTKKKAVFRQVFLFAAILQVLILPSFVMANFADPQLKTPICLDKNTKPIPLINSQIVQWKYNTPNQFAARGHVSGTVSQIFKGNTAHAHFEIVLKDTKEVLEVVYNNEFGRLPVILVGKDVEACGVYITSNARTAQYEASPSGAIIHWTHINPKKVGQPNGYMAYDQKVYGITHKGSSAYLLPTDNVIDSALINPDLTVDSLINAGF